MPEIASCGIFQHKSASQDGLILAGICHKSQLSRFLINTWYFLGLIYNNHEEIQLLTSERKIEEIELAGEDKRIKISMIIHAHF